MKSTIKIGNASGFWGDDINAPFRLAQEVEDLDYLTLDYLAELSMSILAVQKEKSPTMGYAKDFVEVIKQLIPLWKEGRTFKVIANAGGLNSHECAIQCQRVLTDAGIKKKIGIVYGDDVLSILQSRDSFENMETKESIAKVKDKLTTANAYIGAQPLVDLLKNGADIIITGRITDPTLVVAPSIFHFGWSLIDYDKIAGATIAGHLIECGTQVTGGISNLWLEIENHLLGYPFIEMEENGHFIITKPDKTGGVVNEITVKEQLLYEIGDPDNFITPDVIVSFHHLTIDDLGNNRVKVEGARGKPPPSKLKVSATYRDGYKAEGYLTIFGKDSHKKAKLCGESIIQKMNQEGLKPENYLIECIGSGDVVPGVLSSFPESLECILRVSVSDHRQEVVEAFTKLLAPQVTSGPPGVTGYASGRPSVRPVFSYWPCLIDRYLVEKKTLILES